MAFYQQPDINYIISKKCGDLRQRLDMYIKSEQNSNDGLIRVNEFTMEDTTFLLMCELYSLSSPYLVIPSEKDMDILINSIYSEIDWLKSEYTAIPGRGDSLYEFHEEYCNNDTTISFTKILILKSLDFGVMLDKAIGKSIKACGETCTELEGDQRQIKENTLNILQNNYRNQLATAYWPHTYDTITMDAVNEYLTLYLTPEGMMNRQITKQVRAAINKFKRDEESMQQLQNNQQNEIIGLPVLKKANTNTDAPVADINNKMDQGAQIMGHPPPVTGFNYAMDQEHTAMTHVPSSSNSYTDAMDANVDSDVDSDVDSETISEKEKDIIRNSINQLDKINEGATLSPIEELKANYKSYNDAELNILDIGDEENSLFHSVICANSTNQVLTTFDDSGQVNHHNRVIGLRNEIGKQLNELITAADTANTKFTDIFKDTSFDKTAFFECIYDVNSSEFTEKYGYNINHGFNAENLSATREKIQQYISKIKDIYCGDSLTIQLLCIILKINISILAGIKVPTITQYNSPVSLVQSSSSSAIPAFTELVSINTTHTIIQYKLIDNKSLYKTYYDEHVKHYGISNDKYGGTLGKEYVKEIYNLSDKKEYDSNDSEWKSVTINSVLDNDMYDITLGEAGRQQVPGSLLKKLHGDDDADMRDESSLNSLLQTEYTAGESGIFILVKNNYQIDQDLVLVSQTIGHEIHDTYEVTEKNKEDIAATFIHSSPLPHQTEPPMSDMKGTSYSPEPLSVGHTAAFTGVSTLTHNTHLQMGTPIVDQKILLKTYEIEFGGRQELADYQLRPPQSDADESEPTNADKGIFDSYYQLDNNNAADLPYKCIAELTKIDELRQEITAAEDIGQFEEKITTFSESIANENDPIPDPKFAIGNNVRMISNHNVVAIIKDMIYLKDKETWGYAPFPEDGKFRVEHKLELVPDETKMDIPPPAAEAASSSVRPLPAASSSSVRPPPAAAVTQRISTRNNKGINKQLDNLNKLEKKIQQVLKKELAVKVFKKTMPEIDEITKVRETKLSNLKRGIQDDTLIELQQQMVSSKSDDGSVVSFRKDARKKYQSMPEILSENGIEYEMKDIETVERNNKLNMLLNNIVNFKVDSISNPTTKAAVQSKINDILYTNVSINEEGVKEEDKGELKAQLIEKIEKWVWHKEVRGEIRGIVTNHIGEDSQFCRIWGNQLKSHIRGIKEDQSDFTCYQCVEGFNCAGSGQVEMEHKLPVTIFSQYVPFVDNFKIEMEYYKRYRDRKGAAARKLEPKDKCDLLDPMDDETYLFYMYRYINCVFVTNDKSVKWFKHVDYLINKWIREFQIYMFMDIVQNMKKGKARTEYKRKLLSWTIEDITDLSKVTDQDDLSTIFTANSGLQIKHQVFKRVLKCSLFEYGYSHHFCNQVKTSCNFVYPGVRDGYLQMCYDCNVNGTIKLPSVIPTYPVPRQIPGNNPSGASDSEDLFNPDWTRDTTYQLATSDFKNGRKLENMVGSCGNGVTFIPAAIEAEKQYILKAYTGKIDQDKYNKLSQHLRNVFQYMQHTIKELITAKIMINSRNTSDNATQGSAKSGVGKIQKYVVAITPEMIYYYNVAKIAINTEANFQEKILKFLNGPGLIKHLKSQYKAIQKSEKATEKATKKAAANKGGKKNKRTRKKK